MQALPPDFPRFRYHPAPVATGAVVVSDRTCLCCNRARGHIYRSSVYARRRDLREAICPWCVADGSAARAFDAQFVQGYEDEHRGGRLAEPIADELLSRTPGYESWQGEHWLVHCGDAMAFLGDASTETLAGLDDDARQRVRTEHAFLFEQVFTDWAQLVDGYEPGGELALYHFRCLHCGIDRLGCDFS